MSQLAQTDGMVHLELTIWLPNVKQRVGAPGRGAFKEALQLDLGGLIGCM